MGIELSPKHQDIIRDMVESGSFSDETEVIETALDLLDDRNRLAELRQSLIEADEAIERGEGSVWGPELIARIRAKAREMVASGNVPGPDVWP
jgi:Arc/MetJ-type ribon-helix-helix transcriptional regulator